MEIENKIKINPIKWKETNDIAKLYLLSFEDEVFKTIYGYMFRFLTRNDEIIITGYKNECVSVNYNLSKSLIQCFYDPTAVLNFILNDMILKLDDAFAVLMNE